MPGALKWGCLTWWLLKKQPPTLKKVKKPLTNNQKYDIIKTQKKERGKLL